ncbi:MAG: hypothetical protein ACM3RX_04485 [Methanococcaceae archaeon]
MKRQLPILLIILVSTIFSCKSHAPKQQNSLIPNVNNISLDSIGSNKKSQGGDTTTFTFKCNVDFVLEIHENLDSLTVNEIIEFLKVFSIECRNNAEFSEFSNEVLFEVMDRQPDKFIKAICETQADVEYQLIYDEIKSPVHDLIPINKIKKSIESVPQRCERIDSVIKSLDIASRNL